jgi:hypothetical protein
MNEAISSEEQTHKHLSSQLISQEMKCFALKRSSLLNWWKPGKKLGTSSTSSHLDCDACAAGKDKQALIGNLSHSKLALRFSLIIP